MKNRKILHAASYRQNHEFYFRVGMKYFGRNLLGEACRFLVKATDLAPDNSDYQFNLACVYSDLGMADKSNKILFNILKVIDPTMKDCYFAIGYNFFDLKDYKKAALYFEKYIYLTPGGAYIDDALDMLYYIQAYDDTIFINLGKSGSVSRYIKESEAMLSRKEYKKAVNKLEKAMEIKPESIHVRANLSMAYFMSGYFKKAIDYAQSILKLEPSNVMGHCYLSAYYSNTGMKEEAEAQLKALLKLRPKSEPELLLIVHTYEKLERHINILKLLVNYLKTNEMEYLVLHLLSVALFNVGEFDEAIAMWDNIITLFPQYKIITDLYINAVLETKAGVRQQSLMEYQSVLPRELEAEYAIILEKSLEFKTEDLRIQLEQDSLLKNICMYYLFEGKDSIKSNIVKRFMEIKNDEAEVILRKVLEARNTSQTIKSSISKFLKV